MAFTEGISPWASLTQATDGNFYGTTSAGGTGRGTVFKIDSAGTLARIHAFNSGSSPRAGLIQASDGSFYGTTYFGGLGGFGTVFKIDTGGLLTTLHLFLNSDGANPEGRLVQTSDANFYGTTYQGGVSNSGTIFKMDPGGTLTTLASFSYSSSGANPRASLLQATDGGLYGTAYLGGPGDGGVVFRIALSSQTLSVDDVSISEGNSGAVSADFTVTLSAPAIDTVTVHYATADGTATAASDYVGVSGVLTFGPGKTSKTVSISVIGDAAYEPDEDFRIDLSAPVNATVLRGRGTATIVNDDSLPALSISDVSTTEGNSGTSNVTFVVSLSSASGVPTTVDYATADGTATAGSDYVASSGTLTIPAGALSATITVPVGGDNRFEPDESFVVNLGNPSNATILDGQGFGTIRNDDVAPSISVDDASVLEGDSGTTPLVFTVRLSAVSGADVTVDFHTLNASARAGSDYVAASGQLLIPAGSTTGTITVQVIGDTIRERNEAFLVRLSNARNARIVRARWRGRILNDD